MNAMGVVAAFGDAVGKRLMPILEARLDTIQALLEAKVDQFLLDARADIPRIAKDVAQTAVQTVFDNSSVDEAVEGGLGIVTDFFEKFGVKLP